LVVEGDYSNRRNELYLSYEKKGWRLKREDVKIWRHLLYPLEEHYIETFEDDFCDEDGKWYKVINSKEYNNKDHVIRRLSFDFEIPSLWTQEMKNKMENSMEDICNKHNEKRRITRRLEKKIEKKEKRERKMKKERKEKKKAEKLDKLRK
jgi:hypothetical protein